MIERPVTLSEEDRRRQGRPFCKQSIEREDEPAESRGVAAWELSVRREDETGRSLAPCKGLRFQTAEVGHVLGDKGTALGDGGREHLLVGHTLEPPVLGIVDRDDVVTAPSQLLGQRGGKHLVGEKLHSRRRRSRSSVCSSRSASSSTMAMKRSTSSGYSA